MEQGPIVLLVDSDPAFAESVRNTLATHGYQVETCKDADTALYMAQRLKPDVAITDMLLPGMSGFRVVELLKRQDRSLPIIMAATYGGVAQKALAQFLGADEFMPRPVSTNRLLESVRRYCTPGLNPPHAALRLRDASRTA